ncbi:hypothetical protein ACWGOQ_0018260 [Aquimarina sp. M1]
MLKNILNLGKILSKTEQRSTNGGLRPICSDEDFWAISDYCNGDPNDMTDTETWRWCMRNSGCL